MNCIVVGGGVGGLASAIRLAAAGHQVQLFEANAYLGGKLSTFELGPYRFDAGPSLFTMPQLVTELYALCGQDPAEFPYSRKDIGCHYFWEDGTRLQAHADRQQYLDHVHQVLGVEPRVLGAYLDQAAQKYQLTASLFLEQSLHRLDTWLSGDTLRAMARLGSLELFSSLHQVNERHLREPHLVQLYDRFATYNGSDPYRTPGIMSLIQHLESHYGTFIPRHGMGQIRDALEQLARQQGVQIHLSAPVERIVIESGRAVGVQVGGERVAAEAVVSNMDIVPTYRRLLPDQPAPQATLSQERSSSALIFYWGMDRSYPQLGLHNILFSDDYRGEFEALFSGGMHPDPTVYVNITSKDVPQDAPPGHENWFVMVNAPHDKGQDWEGMREQTRERTLTKLERVLDAPIRDHIAVEDTLDPPTIQSRTGSHLGALYGAASNDQSAAFLRHPNFSRRLDGLYFVGGSVHPGGGLPLCLLSARIVAELVGPARP